jgi:hypothetical protein
LHIKHSVEKEDGTYTYQGEFTGKELDFLVEYACNSLMAQGAFPFIMKEKEDANPTMDAPEMQQ